MVEKPTKNTRNSPKKILRHERLSYMYFKDIPSLYAKTMLKSSNIQLNFF